MIFECNARCHANVLYDPHNNSDLMMDDPRWRGELQPGVIAHHNNYHIATVGSPAFTL